jgi:hypothetical protein
LGGRGVWRGGGGGGGGGGVGGGGGGGGWGCGGGGGGGGPGRRRAMRSQLRRPRGASRRVGKQRNRRGQAGSKGRETATRRGRRARRRRRLRVAAASLRSEAGSSAAHRVPATRPVAPGRSRGDRSGRGGCEKVGEVAARCRLSLLGLEGELLAQPRLQKVGQRRRRKSLAEVDAVCLRKAGRRSRCRLRPAAAVRAAGASRASPRGRQRGA